MVFDWLAREGWIIFNWWLLASIAGLTVVPLMVRLLGGLPDKGYTLARPAGILLIAFVFWFMAVLGFVDNSIGSIVLAWVIVLSVVLAVYFSDSKQFDWRTWWAENRRVVIVAEVLFVVLFLSWAVVRAHQNDMRSTEQPMDLAFMSAAQRSSTLPPDDPWLSGYAISYYYFGYVIAAMFSNMSGVWSTTGYNVYIALLFALVGVAAFGVTYNLVRSRARRNAHDHDAHDPLPSTQKQSTALLVGVLGMVFVILLSNFHTILVEIPLQTQIISDEYLAFFDAKDRDRIGEGAIAITNPLDPTQYGYWWWFGASRTVTERDLNGVRGNEVIDEFPMFSFLLADSHPHVMALPYAFLAMAMALNIVLSSAAPDRRQIIFYGLAVGALVFLNTWDSPIYIMLLVGADAVRRLITQGRLLPIDWVEMTFFGVALLVITFGAYLPFLVGFQSQLSGVLPNLLHPTRFQQLFVMFGPFIIILTCFMALELRRGRGRLNWALGLQSGLGALATLLLIVVALMIGGRLSASAWASVQQFVVANGGWDTVIGQVILRRFTPMRLLTLIILLAAIAVIVARLFPRRGNNTTGEEGTQRTIGVAYTPATGFAFLLMGVGVSLILIPEFVYLRDNFGWRMNTVFKFYYQAWAVFSIASAYAVYSIMSDFQQPVNAPLRAAFGGVLAVILAAGFIYPYLGTYHRMFVETGRLNAPEALPLTLDGGSQFTNTDDYVVITCLRELVGRRADVVIAEANPQGSRESYNPNHGRVGTLTGIPIVMGWPNHQSQWRGTSYGQVVGTRRPDLDTLYRDLRIDAVQPIIERYGITHIMYGSTERLHYGSAGEEKFIDHYEVVCDSGNSRVYRVSPVNLASN